MLQYGYYEIKHFLLIEWFVSHTFINLMKNVLGCPNTVFDLTFLQMFAF